MQKETGPVSELISWGTNSTGQTGPDEGISVEEELRDSKAALPLPASPDLRQASTHITLVIKEKLKKR